MTTRKSGDQKKYVNKKESGKGQLGAIQKKSAREEFFSINGYNLLYPLSRE